MISLIYEENMKVGDLVKLKQNEKRNNYYHGVVGLIINLPEYNLVAEILWSDGKRGHIDKAYLEVISGSE